MTILPPIEADFTEPEFEFSPVSVRNTVANKGGAHAGVSRAGCTVNEPYRLNEYLSKTSPRHNQTCQSGTLQENDAPYRLQPYQRAEEVRSIEQGPHSTAQGVLKCRLPNGHARIECGGRLLTGKLIRRKGAGQ